MKPRVFLSHSKKDKAIIERLAIDLRLVRIDVWYDEWEIPVGASLRQKIFEEGIKECDLFFAYLTPNSISSQWCSRELDAASVRDFEAHGGFMALFVDADTTRISLPLDLQALRVPALDGAMYPRAVTEVVALAWEAASRKRAAAERAHLEKQVAELKLHVAEQQLAVERLKSAGAIDYGALLGRLRETVAWTSDGESGAALEAVLGFLGNMLAVGCYDRSANDLLKEFLHYGGKDWIASEFVGPLVIEGLATVIQTGETRDDAYYLTELGKGVLRHMDLVGARGQAKPQDAPRKRRAARRGAEVPD